MRKTVVVMCSIAGLVLCYFTLLSVERMYEAGSLVPAELKEKQVKYRFVLVTQELNTPFWDTVGETAVKEAAKNHVSLQVWGSYENNEDDFLKHMEIAIASKVDGIIVQGLDTAEFKELTKIQAGRSGIPVITVASDVPMNDSLRRTYVGSDHTAAGRMVANELISKLGPKGTVILIGGSRQQYDQDQRLKGIREVFQAYPELVTVYSETSDEREKVISSAREMMNKYPNADAFVAVSSNITDALVNAIGKRYQNGRYLIYSFDDSPETRSLLETGKLDGMIEQSPEEIGKTSVNLMVRWLEGKTIPLDVDGYYTDITMVKAISRP
ncbi:substrate-binding domain-containing protein [Paenibacillus sp. F411]|uniref:sugar ABC transporter substrate-binding protein n=1 Tax=Paenibacillus sp. F411 TaxID=2820239 RepID=UPI001AAE5B38|nr:substrate-binding domain-containing protein [Paenibacillus sp. F411]MBO2943499.1 substrate-binding domain-containing protein [Paenibacillus sp. F411]